MRSTSLRFPRTMPVRADQMIGDALRFACRPTRGFSLVELIIVVVIVGLLAAVAIPRFSRGSAAAGDSATLADLAVLRQAIDLYAAEHNGSYPTGFGFVKALTLYSNAAGATSATPSDDYPFGPYLHAVPALKTGTNAGSSNIASVGARPSVAITGTSVGWIYNATTGQIWANDNDLIDR